jgi:hypothetical protein
MNTTEKLKMHLRSTWRNLLVSVLRLTCRVQDGLELRVKRLTPS